MRTAIQTANLIASQAAEKISDESFCEIVKTMSSYLTCDQDQEEIVDMNALEIMKRKQAD